MRMRKVLLATFGVLAVLGLAPPASSQGWPQKPVRIIVPYPAGGVTDGIGRLMALRLGEAFGQQFVVENRSGAAGAIAAEAVAHAPPDGYTLLLAALPVLATVPVVAKVAYDPVRDLAPISNIAGNAFALAVNGSVPAKTPAEFVAYVRDQPRKLSYASGGIGGLTHLSMALFLKLAGIDMTHVPYRGNTPALSDVVAGHVPAIFTSLSDALPQAAAGTVRLIAVSSEQRAPQLPDVPTLRESGYPTFKITTWNGLMAPAGTPKAVIDRIAKEVVRAVKDPKFAERLASHGVDAIGNGPEEFAARIAADIALWAEALKIAGVQDK